MTPARGTFAGDVRTLTVTGTATDDTGVAAVQVNGVAATLAADGSWTATVPVTPGTQLIHAVARDAQGNAGKESRAVVDRPAAADRRGGPAGDHAPRCRRRRSTRSAAASPASCTPATSQAAVAPLNPVIDVGGGPDCNYVQAAITRMSVGPASRVTMIPQAGGLALDVELDRVAIGMHLAYSVLCLDGASDLSITASHIRVTGLVAVGVRAGAFDIALTGQTVQLTGVDVDLGGLPGDVVRLARSRERARLGGRLGGAAVRRAGARHRARLARRHPHRRRARHAGRHPARPGADRLRPPAAP